MTDKLSKVFGFQSPEEFEQKTIKVAEVEDVKWFITQTPEGKWFAWDEQDVELLLERADRIKMFSKKEEAIKVQRSLFEDIGRNKGVWLAS